MHIALAIASLLGFTLSTADLPTKGPAPAFAPPADTVLADQELVQNAQAARVLGASDGSAEVTILEFFDYSCSTCQQFHVQRGDSLKALAGPDLSLRFHHYIIPRLPRGYAAAEAATCAAGLGGSDGFFAFHDRLLRESTAWRSGPRDSERFQAWAVAQGLPAAEFADCLERDVTAQLIFADDRLGATLGVQGTPTFVVLPRGAQSAEEVIVFYGNEPMSRFREAIAEARSRAR